MRITWSAKTEEQKLYGRLYTQQRINNPLPILKKVIFKAITVTIV